MLSTFCIYSRVQQCVISPTASFVPFTIFPISLLHSRDPLPLDTPLTIFLISLGRRNPRPRLSLPTADILEVHPPHADVRHLHRPWLLPNEEHLTLTSTSRQHTLHRLYLRRKVGWPHASRVNESNALIMCLLPLRIFILISIVLLVILLCYTVVHDSAILFSRSVFAIRSQLLGLVPERKLIQRGEKGG
jgi:hypothetical protein